MIKFTLKWLLRIAAVGLMCWLLWAALNPEHAHFNLGPPPQPPPADSK